VHSGLGLFGNALFVIGSVMFFWESVKTLGIWLFVFGSLGMLLGSVGELLARIEKRPHGLNQRHGAGSCRTRTKARQHPVPHGDGISAAGGWSATQASAFSGSPDRAVVHRRQYPTPPPVDRRSSGSAKTCARVSSASQGWRQGRQRCAYGQRSIDQIRDL